ncbi:hemerythrin family protein [Pelagicoccus sp. SDUM812002]|uniref:bacteriohemerythrin n=1 Tax=Pelagicoccus sp. SDUM812002 TaxID=3041266 RepID=UPI00281062D3|nr:hemerythrin family protein [Pelagicoccus sp. SDUM812002]MDQ8186261.1 hemerythrin family protein [Pelagicoccus sp. SDUM812002]
MAIEWRKNFATNDPHIDEQHQQIFRFANKLEAIAEQAEVDTREVDHLLRFLETYIQNHFRYEEACMLKRRCPVAQKNRSEHLAFKGYLTRTLEVYHQNGYSQEWAQTLYSKLENWLSNHICRVDVQLSDYPERVATSKAANSN